jgi:hypothetical protein
MISPDQTTKFQSLCKKHFGQDLNFSEAREKGEQLVQLIRLIYQPMTQDEYDRLQVRREESDKLSN